MLHEGENLSKDQCLERLGAIMLRIKKLQFQMEQAVKEFSGEENKSFLQDIRQSRIEIWDCMELAKSCPPDREDDVLKSLRMLVKVWENMLRQIDEFVEGRESAMSSG